ncbi:MAG: hypothetical protein AAF387_22000, partial [Pseudomonadota bacterium]
MASLRALSIKRLMSFVVASVFFVWVGSAQAIVLAESIFDPGMDFDGWTGVECTNPGICPVDGDVGPLDPSKFFHDDSDPQGFEPGIGYLEIVDPDGGTTG